jgi:hypothetical protein
MLNHRRSQIAALGFVLSLPLGGVAQAVEVNVGGFLDQGLSALQNQLSPSDSSLRGFGLRVVENPHEPVMGFTPRFAGVPVDLPEGASIDSGSLLKARLGSPLGGGETVERALALQQQHHLGLFNVDVSAVAGFAEPTYGDLGQSSSFGFGGGLTIDGIEGLRFDASYGRLDDVFGLTRDHVTAGVGYGIGMLDTRLSVSSVASYDNGVATDEKQIFSVGGQLNLSKSWVVGGDLAYSSGLAGEQATTGVVNFRFNF